MHYIMPLRIKIERAILGDYRTVSNLLGLSAILLAIGFFVSDIGNANTNYALLIALAPKLFWATSFLVYGVTKILSSIYRVWLPLKIANTLYGLWLWSYIVLSFILFDKTPVAPTELILFISIVCEVWSLAIILYNRKNTRR